MVRRAETDGKIGRSRGGLTSKIHAVTDGAGKPMEFIITAGNVNDSTKAIELLKNIIRKGIRVLADRGTTLPKFSHTFNIVAPLSVFRRVKARLTLRSTAKRLTKTAIKSNVFSNGSKISAVLPLDMINYLRLFYPSSISPPFAC